MAGGGRYDNLVGMFDPKGRKVKQLSIIHTGTGYNLYTVLVSTSAYLVKTNRTVF